MPASTRSGCALFAARRGGVIARRGRRIRRTLRSPDSIDRPLVCRRSAGGPSSPGPPHNPVTQPARSHTITRQVRESLRFVAITPLTVPGKGGRPRKWRSDADRASAFRARARARGDDEPPTIEAARESSDEAAVAWDQVRQLGDTLNALEAELETTQAALRRAVKELEREQVRSSWISQSNDPVQAELDAVERDRADLQERLDELVRAIATPARNSRPAVGAIQESGWESSWGCCTNRRRSLAPIRCSPPGSRLTFEVHNTWSIGGRRGTRTPDIFLVRESSDVRGRPSTSAYVLLAGIFRPTRVLGRPPMYAAVAHCVAHCAKETSCRTSIEETAKDPSIA